MLTEIILCLVPAPLTVSFYEPAPSEPIEISFYDAEPVSVSFFDPAEPAPATVEVSPFGDIPPCEMCTADGYCEACEPVANATPVVTPVAAAVAAPAEAESMESGSGRLQRVRGAISRLRPQGRLLGRLRCRGGRCG